MWPWAETYISSTSTSTPSFVLIHKTVCRNTPTLQTGQAGQTDSSPIATVAQKRFALRRANRFWATVCKAVRVILSDRCPVCLSVCPVCNVGVLWPNGWMNQDKTWHGGRPRLMAHCVTWGRYGHIMLDGRELPPKGEHNAPNFRPLTNTQLQRLQSVQNVAARLQ